MPIRIEWVDQEQTLIYAEPVGRSEHEDFIFAIDQFLAMLQSVSHPVDVIYDARHQVAFTPGILKTAYEIHRYKYPNLRFMVFVGRNLAWELFLIFVRRFGVVSYRFMLVETLDAALTPPPSSADWN